MPKNIPQQWSRDSKEILLTILFTIDCELGKSVIFRTKDQWHAACCVSQLNSRVFSKVFTVITVILQINAGTTKNS